MNKHDAISLTLNGIRGRDKEADVQTNGEQNRRWPSKEGNELSSQSVEGGRSRVFEPVN
jgi:hypothetical protein